MPTSRFRTRGSRRSRLAGGWAVAAIASGAAFAQTSQPCAPQWSPWPSTASGMDSYVRTLLVMPQGSVVAGGHFSTAGGLAAANVAEWNGSSWTALGSGTTGFASQVNALVLWEGSLIVGGDFSSAGGLPARNIAVWDPTNNTWAALGTGLGVAGDDVTSLVVWRGKLIAGGSFSLSGSSVVHNVAEWTASSGTWSPLGQGTNGFIKAMASMLNDGNLVVGGGFNQAGGLPATCIAQWDGNAWSPVGSVINNNVYALTTLRDGHIAAGGDFTTPSSGVALWDGTSWVGTPGTNGRVNRIHELPNGDWLVGGSFTSAAGTPVSRVARWHTSSGTWSALGTGMDNIVVAFAELSDGSIVAGGDFVMADGTVSPYLANLASGCPGSSMPYGAGCSGNTLVADAPPWVDATFHATGSGLPQNAIVLHLTSLASVPQGLVPLTVAFLQAIPGCDLLVPPDILDAVVTTNGTAHSHLFLPSSPPFVGVPFFHQMVPIELDAQGRWVAVTATNALRLSAGMF